MAVSVATPYVNNDGGLSVTSGNFDLVANDLYVLVAHCDTRLDSIDVLWTLTDNQIPDLTWTLISERDGSDGDGGLLMSGLAHQSEMARVFLPRIKAAEALRNSILLSIAMTRRPEHVLWPEAIDKVSGPGDYLDFKTRHRVRYALGRAYQKLLVGPLIER